MSIAIDSARLQVTETAKMAQKTVRFEEVVVRTSCSENMSADTISLTLSSNSSGTTATSKYSNRSMPEIGSEDDKLVCNYDTSRSKLYTLLEASDWDAVLARCESDPTEVRTWVIRYQKRDPTRVRWKLLPLHTAVIFKSPAVVVEKLLEVYPEACAKTDDQGMTPLHLAFRHYDEDECLIKILLKKYPQGVHAKDSRGRTPLDLAMKRTGTYSAKLMRLYTDTVLKLSTTNEKEEQTIDSVSAVDTVVSELKSQHERELESVMSVLKSQHEQKMESMHKMYQERMLSVLSTTMVSLKKLQRDALEANREARDQHYLEMLKLKEKIAEKEILEKNQSDKLREEIDSLKQTPPNPKSSESLLQQIRTIQGEQDALHELIQAQQEELATAQGIRAMMIQTLLRQDEEDFTIQKDDGERISILAMNISARLKELSGDGAAVSSPVTTTSPATTVIHDDDSISTLTEQPSL